MNTRLENVVPSGNRLELPAQPRVLVNEGAIRVWLVDDDPSLRELLAALLNLAHGINCTRVFSSAQAAMQALSREPAPDVLLLDLHLGKEDGINAVGVFKAKALRMPIFIVSVFYDSYQETRALQAGARGLLAKHDIERIIDQIRRTRPLSFPAPTQRPVFPGCN